MGGRTTENAGTAEYAVPRGKRTLRPKYEQTVTYAGIGLQHREGRNLFVTVRRFFQITVLR